MSLEQNLVGRVLRAVTLNQDRTRVTFDFREGAPATYQTFGDCCSRSWVEHLEMPTDVDGARIMAVGQSDSVVVAESDPEHDYLQAYAEQVITDRGEISIEFRNSSNGYYGGSLDEVAATEGD